MQPKSLDAEVEQLCFAVYNPANGAVFALFADHTLALSFANLVEGAVMSTIGEWDADKR